jgi:hypothetical protein
MTPVLGPTCLRWLSALILPACRRSFLPLIVARRDARVRARIVLAQAQASSLAISRCRRHLAQRLSIATVLVRLGAPS